MAIRTRHQAGGFLVNQHGDIPDSAYSVTELLLQNLKSVDLMTFHHCLRVGEYSRLLSKAMGLSDYQQKLAQFSGLLHDIGKGQIAGEVLHKPGKLTEEEFKTVMNHSVHSEDLIRPKVSGEFWDQVIPSVRGHHERVDGKGYPDGLIGDEIPIISRVILVVDTLDAMAETRPYRKGLPLDLIYKEILRCAGSQFDLQMAKVFLESHRLWKSEKLDQETLFRIAPPERAVKAA